MSDIIEDSTKVHEDSIIHTMSKTCTICGENKKTKEFYKGRHQCIPCYLARNKVSTADLEHVRDRLEHVVGRVHRTRVRHRNKMAKLKTRVGDLEDKVSDITNMFEQMQVENTQLKTRLDLAVSHVDKIQVENTGLKTNLDLAVFCLDKMLVNNTRIETNLELAGYRMDEMQGTIDNSVSVTSGVDDAIKTIQEEADKRLRRVARMFVLVDHESRTTGKLTTDDYYNDFTGGTSIGLANKSTYRKFDPEKLIWEDI